MKPWRWWDYALVGLGFSAIIGAVVWLGHTRFVEAMAR